MEIRGTNIRIVGGKPLKKVWWSMKDPANVVEHVKVETDRGCSFDQARYLLAQAELEAQRGDDVQAKAMSNQYCGFYSTRKSFKGKYFVSLIVEKPRLCHSMPSNVTIFRPLTGRHELARNTCFEKYKPIQTKAEAEQMVRNYTTAVLCCSLS